MRGLHEDGSGEPRQSRGDSGTPAGGSSDVNDMTMSASGATARTWESTKAMIFAGIVTGVVLVDFLTKMAIQRTFHLYQQVDLIGEYVRLTYIFNPGAAFGIHVGPYSRVIFLSLSVAALLALAAMYWVTPVTERIRLMAIASICGGAIGNLIDRVRSSSGVVDFVDVGIGTVRWPVFNVADIAVTAGAIFLALSLWREELDDVERR